VTVTDYHWTRVVRVTLIVVATLIALFLIVLLVLVVGNGQAHHGGYIPPPK
jgi:hypothetical protein